MLMEDHLLIRDAALADIPAILDLYLHLHEETVPSLKDAREIFAQIINSGMQQILVGEFAGQIVSTCTVIIIPNLTRELRPYCLIENVVTHEGYRKKGFATKLLTRAKEIAIRENCYKIMLMTGAKKEDTFAFYESAGFNRQDKTAFVLWL